MSRHKTRQIARISEATLLLIQDEGLSRLSMSKIAEAAGVTRQTVYNYFPDVQSIIAQALHAHSVAMEKHLLAIIEAADGPRNKLWVLANFQISLASSEHESISLEAGLSAENREQLDQHTNSVKKLLAQIVVSGMKAGDFSAATEPVVASDLLWEFAKGAASTAASYPDQKSYILEAAVKAMLAVLAD